LEGGVSRGKAHEKYSRRKIAMFGEDSEGVCKEVTVEAVK
jgi:hypothetical protein